MALTEPINHTFLPCVIWFVNRVLPMCLCFNATGAVTLPIMHSTIWFGLWISELGLISTSSLRNWKSFVPKLHWCVVSSGADGSTIGDGNTKHVLQKIWYRVSRICSTGISLSVSIWLTEERLSVIGEVQTTLLIPLCAVRMIMTLRSVKPDGPPKSFSCFAIYWKTIFRPVNHCLNSPLLCLLLRFPKFILIKWLHYSRICRKPNKQWIFNRWNNSIKDGELFCIGPHCLKQSPQEPFWRLRKCTTGRKSMPTANFWRVWTVAKENLLRLYPHWKKVRNWIFWWKQWDVLTLTNPFTTAKVSRKRWNLFRVTRLRNWKTGLCTTSR